MVGIMDVGGGLRTVYSAGIYDYLLERDISLKYCIGVSAGSANLITYVARQRGRNLPFYTEYAFRGEYMSFSNLIKKHTYIDLDYVYSTLCNAGGENPLDFDAFKHSDTKYVAVATKSKDGSAKYFDNSDVREDDYGILKASCAIPAVCKPYRVGDDYFYDGGVADPFPYKKAFADGCDKLIAVITRPVSYTMTPQRLSGVMRLVLREHPQIATKILNRHIIYNSALAQLRRLEAEGRVLIVAPDNCFGVNTLTKDRGAMKRLYDEGYSNARKIESFLQA